MMEIAEQSMTRPYYRRKLFFSTFVIVLLAAAFVAAGLLELFSTALGDRYGEAIRVLHHAKQVLVPRAVGLYVVITGLLVLTLSVLHIFYSHRVAGPAFRLGREAEKISGGNLKADFQLRSKDNLSDLADALKQTASRYRDTVIALERHTVSLEAQAAALSEKGAEANPAALDPVLREMTSTVGSIDKLLSEIRL